MRTSHHRHGKPFLILVALFVTMIGHPGHASTPSARAAAIIAPSTKPNTVTIIPAETVTCSNVWERIYSRRARATYAVDALSATNAWAVGTKAIPFAPGNQPFALHWDGTRWLETAMPTFPNGQSVLLFGVAAISATNVWAVGTAYYNDGSLPVALRWNGTQWARVPMAQRATYDELYGIAAVGPNAVYAVGVSNDHAMVLRWNGSAWVDEKLPASVLNARSKLQALTVVSANDIWAVGGSLIVHWNGVSWTIYPDPGDSEFDMLRAIDAVSRNDIWAVGTDGLRPVTLHWNGTTWTHVPSPSNGVGANEINGVAALGPNDIWAVGNGSYHALTMHWNGSEWRFVETPGEYLNAIDAISTNDLFAVGINQILHHHTTVGFDSSVLSGSPGSGSIPAAVTLSGSTPQTVTVDYTVSAGTATGNDFTATSAKLTLPPCTQSGNVNVAVNTGADWSRLKTIKLALTNPLNARLGVNPTTTLSVFDPQRATPGMQIHVPIARMAAPRDGRIAFVSSRDGNSEIYTMKPDGSDQRNVTRNPAKDEFPAWSPDGKRIAFTSYRDGGIGIYVMNADGSGQTTLTTEGFVNYAPAWSPDGQQIAFSSNRLQKNGVFYNLIYVMNADGSNIRQLSQPEKIGVDPFDAQPAWSPDGRQIAFSSRRSDTQTSQIYVMNADGSQMRPLLKQTFPCSGPSWSPDGLWLAFACNVYSAPDLFIASADGQELRLVNNNFDTGDWPSWSSEGERIVFTNDDDVYITGFDHRQPIRLTQTMGADYAPDWTMK